MSELDVQEGDYVEMQIGKRKKRNIGGYIVAVGPIRVRVRVSGGRNRMFYLKDIICWIKNQQHIGEKQQ